MAERSERGEPRWHDVGNARHFLLTHRWATRFREACDPQPTGLPQDTPDSWHEWSGQFIYSPPCQQHEWYSGSGTGTRRHEGMGRSCPYGQPGDVLELRSLGRTPLRVLLLHVALQRRNSIPSGELLREGFHRLRMYSNPLPATLEGRLRAAHEHANRFHEVNHEERFGRNPWLWFVDVEAL